MNCHARTSTPGTAHTVIIMWRPGGDWTGHQLLMLLRAINVWPESISFLVTPNFMTRTHLTHVIAPGDLLSLEPSQPAQNLTTYQISKALRLLGKELEAIEQLWTLSGCLGGFEGGWISNAHVTTSKSDTLPFSRPLHQPD